jgi:hypothetical protein
LGFGFTFRKLPFFLASLALLLTPMLASAQLSWRVSVKFILSAGGSRPASGALNTDQDVRDQIDNANEVLASYGRGYRFLLTEIVDLAGVSQWYSVDRDEKPALEAAAEANKALYAYRDNAINIYINGAEGSAVCSFPPGDDIIFMGQGSRSTSIFHEAGHYFDLRHTHQGEDYQNSNGTDCTNGCACARLIGGTTDGIDDTIADHQCWGTQNEIAQGNFGLNYSSLSAFNRGRVDDVFFNMMSYHGTRNRLTPDQLDRMTDTSNGDRFNAATGRTRFVDRANQTILQFGSSAFPYSAVSSGVTAANPGDIVLIRPGHYNQPQTITKRLTLRATRGDAVIGIP